MKQIQKTVVCAILAIELLMGFCASGAVSFAETPEVPAALPAEVTVSASGTVRLVPDKASVAFGVTTEEASADLAQSKNSEAVDKVIAVLTERGIEEKSIRTTNYSLYPQYDYSDGVSRIIGYSVCTTLLIQDQDIENVGKLLADCVAAGVNHVDQVSFLCSGYDEAYREALAEAVQNARVKAEVLAKAAGKTLGEAVSVTEGWQDSSVRYDKGAIYQYAAMDSVASPSFMPGESEISANVTVTYAMK